ncbi:MAG: hypothetical protein CW338_06330 [Clostridiales bacterium]|nr:hypothetical protein [Clostridiales bacterium]
MQYIYLIGEEDNTPAVSLLKSISSPEEFRLVCIPVENWNRQLSPWPSPGLRQGEDFTGEACTFLNRVRETIATAESGISVQPRDRSILGYSLAGLFSLWCACETCLFGKAASVSGSLWYDGWTDYIASRSPLLRYAYLSVGVREKNAGNRRMQCVEQNTLFTRNILQEKGIPCDFELNPGGHFNHPEDRLKRAAEQLLCHS